MVERFAALLEAAEAPVFVAGRGRARRPRRELEALAGRTGALLATSAVAKGLFAGSPWSLDVSGGFASPLAAELIEASDLVVGVGLRPEHVDDTQGELVGPGATVVQVDLDPTAPGRHLPVDLGVHGDVAEVADRVRGAGHGPRPAGVPTSCATASRPGSAGATCRTRT